MGIGGSVKTNVTGDVTSKHEEVTDEDSIPYITSYKTKQMISSFSVRFLNPNVSSQFND
jgi:hypothetical protein